MGRNRNRTQRLISWMEGRQPGLPTLYRTHLHPTLCLLALPHPQHKAPRRNGSQGDSQAQNNALLPGPPPTPKLQLLIGTAVSRPRSQVQPSWGQGRQSWSRGPPSVAV